MEQTPFDLLPENQKERLWDIYMSMERSALVEEILANKTAEELEQFIAELDEMDQEDLTCQ